MGIFCTSVVARMNFTCCGRVLSIVLRSALNAEVGEHVDFVDDVDLVAATCWSKANVFAASSRTSPTPLLLA